MWRGETVAVVLPTYNEAESIADLHQRVSRDLGFVDDIVVVNNNAPP